MHAITIANNVVLLLAYATVAGCATKPQAAEWEATGPVVLTVTADGVQTYRCESGGDGKLVWKFIGPQADLFDDKHAKVGTHSKTDAGPQWEVGGDVVVGTKLHERAAGKSAIPELQLRGKCAGSGSVFGKVVMIERLDTEGGVSPSTEGRKAGEVERVPYKARYVFHAART